MKWLVIFIIIIAIIIVVLSLFTFAYIKQRREIIAKGGIKTIYKTVVNGLLKYHSARIIQDKTDFLTIGGTFTDPFYCNRECGLWSVIIRPTFKVLNVRYQAYIDLGGDKTVRKEWNFPVNMDQEEILTIIKKEADKWTVFGLIK
ncbi:MAG: hypothetical protein K2H97_00825 [Prevotella sp.]|nr:hypothetical protein [Prevotella sp.]